MSARTTTQNGVGYDDLAETSAAERDPEKRIAILANHVDEDDDRVSNKKPQRY